MASARKGVRKKEMGMGGAAVSAGGSPGKGLLRREGGRARRCIAAQQPDSDQCRAPAVNCVLSQPVAMNVAGFFPLFLCIWGMNFIKPAFIVSAQPHDKLLLNCVLEGGCSHKNKIPPAPVIRNTAFLMSQSWGRGPRAARKQIPLRILFQYERHH